MSEQIFQTTNIVIEQPLRRIVHLVARRIPKEVRLVGVVKVFPIRAAKTAIQSVAPIVGDIAQARDQPVDCHTQREIDDDLKILGCTERRDRLPVQVRTIGIQKCDPFGVSAAEPRDQFLDQAVGVAHLHIDFACREV